MTEPQPQRPWVGVHLLLIKEEKILLMKRAVKTESFGKYAVPAGRADIHESPRVALAREAMEEVGINILPEDLEHVATIHHAKTPYLQQDHDIIEFYFIARKFDGTPINMEPEKASELDFYPLDDLPQPTPKGLLLALEALNGGPDFIEN